MKTLEVPARKSSDGKGMVTQEHWEMCVHKYFIGLDADERVLRQPIRVQVLNDVSIEIIPGD